MTDEDPLEEPSESESEQGDGRLRIALSSVWNGITLHRIGRFLAVVSLITVPLAILYVSWQLAGPLATIIYAILFGAMFALIPTLIGIFGSATPGGEGLGKAHFIMGNFAAGFPYLLQIGDKYEIVPGTEERFWYDGEWYDIDAGLRNRTVLGWRPFGFLWFKSETDLEQARTDPAAQADGGTHDVTRAGIREVAPSTGEGAQQCPGCGAKYETSDRLNCPDCDEILIAEELKGMWLVDLKRLYRTGLEQIGNIDLVETAEEQTMRDEVGSGTINEWSIVIGSVIGVVLGVATGYVMFMV